MFLRHRLNHDIVEILDVDALFDPFAGRVAGRYHAGEEMQEPTMFRKPDLVFLSGEQLPRCWVDAHYRDASADP
ncbi:MAG: acetyltransferase [Pseudomonadota bacterium]|nr:acetyltransferase [Pseudomonadota bacterium]